MVDEPQIVDDKPAEKKLDDSFEEFVEIDLPPIEDLSTHKLNQSPENDIEPLLDEETLQSPVSDTIMSIPAKPEEPTKTDDGCQATFVEETKDCSESSEEEEDLYERSKSLKPNMADCGI